MKLKLSFIPKTLLLAVSIITLAASGRAQVQINDDVNYFMTGSRLTVYLEDLENHNDTKTGTLRIRVYASTDHWTESEPGHLLGSNSLPRLGANRDRNHIRRSMKLHRPDSDWYYVTLVVEERVDDETGKHWEVRDFRESDDRVFIQHYMFSIFPWESGGLHPFFP
jgi:hypothetical protein